MGATEDPETDGPAQLVEQVGSTLLAVGDLFSPQVSPERRSAAAEKRCRREPLPAGPELPCPSRCNTHCPECDASGSVAHGTCQVCGHLISDSVGGPVSSSPSASVTSQSSQPAASGGGSCKGMPIAEMFWDPCLGGEDEPSTPLARVSSPVVVKERPTARRSLFEESAGPGGRRGCQGPTAGLPACSAADEDASVPGTPHKEVATQEIKETQDPCLGNANCEFQSLPSQADCKTCQEVTCMMPLKPKRATRNAPPPPVNQEMVRVVPGKSTVAAKVVSSPDQIELSTPSHATPSTPPCLPPPMSKRRPLRSSGPGLSSPSPAPASKRAAPYKQSLWAAAFTLVFSCTVILVTLQMRKPMGAIERPAVLGRLDADLAAAGAPPEHEVMARENLFQTTERESTSILNVTAMYLRASEQELHAVEDAGTQPWLSSLRMIKGNQEVKGERREAASGRSTPVEAVEKKAAVQEPATAHSASHSPIGLMEADATFMPSASTPDDEFNVSRPYSPSLASLLPSMLSSEETDTPTDVALPSRKLCGLSLQTSLLDRRPARALAVEGLAIRQTSLMKAPKNSINWIHRKIVLGMYCKLYRYAAEVIVGVASKKKTDLPSNPLTRIGIPPKFIVAVTDRMANVIVASANSTLELLDCTPRDLWRQ